MTLSAAWVPSCGQKVSATLRYSCTSPRVFHLPSSGGTAKASAPATPAGRHTRLTAKPPM
ncbi:hypothetical protein DERA104750_01850 [Deinococcus radiodurans]